MMNGCFYDARNNKMTVNNPFYQAAKVCGSHEQAAMAQAMRDFPTASVSVNKKTAHRMMTYKKMEAFIKADDKAHGTNNWEEYQVKLAASKLQKCPYKYMTEWFAKKVNSNLLPKDNSSKLSAVK